MHCCVKKCQSVKKSSKNRISFHRFPVDPTRREAWLKSIGANFVSMARPLICSIHFEPNQVDRNPGSRPYLRKAAIPSIFPNNKKTPNDDLLIETESSDNIHRDEYTLNDFSDHEIDASLKLKNPEIMPTSVTYNNTYMNIKAEKDPLELGNGSAAVIENTFVGQPPGRILTWEQARFIEFMSSHILQMSLPLQNEFLDGVMGLYLEIAKRNH